MRRLVWMGWVDAYILVLRYLILSSDIDRYRLPSHDVAGRFGFVCVEGVVCVCV